MKRFSVFILSLVYLVTTTGATLQLHYCMGQYAGWSIAGNSEKKCGRCGMKKKQSVDNGCCKDEQKLVKIQDDQKVDNLSFDCMKWTATTQVHANPDFSHQLASAKEVLPRSNAPPRSYPTDIHIINCVFRI